nr:hypothetical protein L203_02231 [Cryptococcus depauperatus CBS 7841]
MALFFRSQPSSYASEQLLSQLSSLSTLPVNLPPSASAFYSQQAPPSPHLQNALLELSSHKIGKQKLEKVLNNLVQHLKRTEYKTQEASGLDELLELEVLGRAVTVLWKEVLEMFVHEALKLEEERDWWNSLIRSRQGVSIYFLQTMPSRLISTLPPVDQLTFPSMKNLKAPSKELFFKNIDMTTSAAITSIMSPWTLTRQEVSSFRSELTRARDKAARCIGILASQGPQWISVSQEGTFQAHGDILSSETQRIYTLLCNVLDVPLPRARKSRSSSPPQTISTPSSLLSILSTHLPSYQIALSQTVAKHKRPGPLTRLWLPFLFLPPALFFAASAVVRNKDWMKEQVKNAKETVRGFFFQWVWEPLAGIGKTIRRGGEGLGVTPTTVQCDQASLERMVVDLGRDYYHLSGPALEALGEKVRAGDMENVLRVYEKEMQSPIKNALMGSLIRTLLIQVQKTKTDLSLSLLSLDHLLRSQQLTFAFVGLAPSLLILYGLGGWLKSILQNLTCTRSIERLLLVSHDAQEMSHCDRGLLIISVSSLRTWAVGLGSNSQEVFMDDLRLVEDPSLARSDKLRAIERIWRCWGLDGKKKY